MEHVYKKNEKSVANQVGYDIIVLKEGYSNCLDNGNQMADGTITLIKGCHNIIVDTGHPWDGNIIIEGLRRNGLSTDDIEYVVGTHGHSDHIGNLNLFQKAVHIVGFDVCNSEAYLPHPFHEGKSYRIDDRIDIIPTPGHTHSDVSVVVKNTELGTVVIAGDLFEKEEDINDALIWQEVSENPELQEKNRQKVLDIADFIIPGHGKMFKVPESVKI